MPSKESGRVNCPELKTWPNWGKWAVIKKAGLKLKMAGLNTNVCKEILMGRISEK